MHHSRLLLATAILAVTIAAAACARGPTSPDTVAGTPFQLKAGTTAVLPDGTRIKFDRVLSESRCPLDAICVTAGDAAILVSFISRDGTGGARELHTQPDGSQIAYGSYTIALTELQPYPRASEPVNPADYVATFVVSVR
jgi:hypothetical protein